IAAPNQYIELKGSMTRESIAHALSVLSGLFEYLTSQRYLLTNPMRGLPSLASNRAMRVDHRVNHRLWQRITDRLSQIAPADTVAYRTVFAIRLLYLTGLRLSEMCALSMSDILVQESDEGKIPWYLNIFGKGNRTRQVYLVKPAQQAIESYLAALGLAEDPRLNEADMALVSYRKWEERENVREGQWVRRGVFHTVIYADIKRFLRKL